MEGLRLGGHVVRRGAACGGDAQLRRAPEVGVEPEDECRVGGRPLSDGAHLGHVRHQLVKVVERQVDARLAGELTLVEENEVGAFCKRFWAAVTISDKLIFILQKILGSGHHF